MEYKLEKNARRDYCVIGLKDPDHDPEWEADDMFLFVRYGDGCIATITENNQLMHESLYDLYQTCATLKNGDAFTIDGVVVYRCEGVHVTKVD